MDLFSGKGYKVVYLKKAILEEKLQKIWDLGECISSISRNRWDFSIRCKTDTDKIDRGFDRVCKYDQ